MLKIRLKRVGRKHDPSYRVVVTEKHRGPKSGKYIEKLGHYDARTNTKTINGERVKHWIGVGAQVSDTVHNLLVAEGILDGKKKNVLPKKKPIIKEKTEEEAKTEEPKEEATEDKSEEKVEEVKEEAPAEEVKEEAPAEKAPAEEAPAEEVKEEEKPAEETAEETKEETPAE